MNRRRYSSWDEQLAGLTISLILLVLGGFIVLLPRLLKRKTPPYAPAGIDTDRAASFLSFAAIRPPTVTDIVVSGVPLTVLAVSLGTGVLVLRFVQGGTMLLSVRFAGLVLALLSLLLVYLALSTLSRTRAGLTGPFAVTTAFGGILFCVSALFVPAFLTGGIPSILLSLVAIAAILTLMWVSGTSQELSAVSPGLITIGAVCALLQWLWVGSSRVQPPAILSLGVVSFLAAVLLGYLAGDIHLPGRRGTLIAALLFAGILATLLGMGANVLSGLSPQMAAFSFFVAFAAPSIALSTWLFPQQGDLHLPDTLFLTNTAPQAARSITIYPKQRELEPETAQDLIGALVGRNHRLTLSIVSEAGHGMTWRVSDPSGHVSGELLERDIKTYHSGAVVAETTDTYQPTLPVYRQVIVFGLANDYAAPLPSIDMLKPHDPLASIGQRMDLVSAEKCERITYQVMVVTKTATAKTSATERLTNGQVRPLSGIARNPDDPIAGLDIAVLNGKLNQDLYHCILTVTIESTDRSHLTALAQIAGDVEHIEFPGYNCLVRQFTSGVLELTQPEQVAQNSAEILLEAWKRRIDANWRSALAVVSVGEIATLWHLPTDAFAAPSIAWGSTNVPVELTDPNDAVLLGEIVRPGAVKQPVFLKTVDRRRHHYIAGMPGMGKTTFMHSLIQQDIGNGNGVVVIDPHGTLIEAILATSIPAMREHDVILLECGRRERPVPINPFRLPPEVMVDQAYNFVLYAMQRVYASIWLEGQTQGYIQHLVQLLLTDPDATPRDIYRVLDPEDSTYLKQLLAGLKNNPRVSKIAAQQLRQFWTTFSKYTKGKKQEIALPILNRTGLFLGTPLLTSMTCHPTTIDFRRYLQEKKIVLINLAGDAVFSEVDSLATLFLSGFLLAAFSLGAIPDNDPPRAYVYVDELERMTGAPIPMMVAEARKFGLSLIVTNQTLNQLPTDVLNGILGTVETRSVFQLGMLDAQKFAPEFVPDVTAEDIRNLGQWRIAVRTSARGKPVLPFIMNTVKPEAVPNPVAPKALRQRANETLLSYEEVEHWLETRYPDPTPDETPEEQPPSTPPKARPVKQPPQAKDLPPVE